MQRSWLKFGITAVLLVLTGILWDSSMVWASPDQSPPRQTVPTRVKTDIPTSVPSTNTPGVVPATSVPPTKTKTATATQPAPTLTATRQTSTATLVMLTVTSVLSIATPVPQLPPNTDGSVLVMAIIGIIVVILGALVFVLRRRGSR